MAAKIGPLAWITIAGITIYFLVSNNSASAETFSVSQNILSLTESLESFRANAYPDGSSGSTQLYSIGYGHQIQPNEGYLMNSPITTDQAEQLLISDMQNVVNSINQSGVNFTPGQFAALADFGYSAGIGAMNKVINTFVSEGSNAAASEILGYVYWHPVAGGPAELNDNLVSRRNSEVDSWNS